MWESYNQERRIHPGQFFLRPDIVAHQGICPFIPGIGGHCEQFTLKAAEWAPAVRVNCIAPSLTDTPLAARLLNSDEKKESAGARHPLKRVGTAEEIAALAHFLLAGNSGWITGQVIGADGGMSTLKI